METMVLWQGLELWPAEAGGEGAVCHPGGAVPPVPASDPAGKQSCRRGTDKWHQRWNQREQVHGEAGAWDWEMWFVCFSNYRIKIS